MSKPDVNRRNFHKLTMAAFGGMVAGAGSSSLAQAQEGNKPKINVDPALLLSDPNVCRGLNTCDGKGKGDHACAGQAACTSVAAHSCAGENECKGQGGCGGYPGQNVCQSKGKCAVPLKAEVWKLARKQFEQLMKDNGKMVGAAPK